jgi:hypothetical protein
MIFHLGKIAGQSVEMDRPAVVEGDAAATVGIRSSTVKPTWNSAGLPLAWMTSQIS